MRFMEVIDASEITQLLREWSGGDASALNRLLPQVHAELQRIAGRNLRRRSSNDTLTPTALVNEAYMRLCRLTSVDWNDRVHFFAVSAQLMRRILVDHARARSTEKRGGGMLVTFNDNIGFPAVKAPDLLDLDRALSELEALDQRQARIPPRFETRQHSRTRRWHAQTARLRHRKTAARR
jgi:RNA polymerase sigma-70 factor, ECF subfamily